MCSRTATPWRVWLSLSSELSVAVIGGDGIGPEVTKEAQRVLEACRARYGVPVQLRHWDLGADRYLRDGVTISEAEFEELTGSSDAVLLGALGDPRVPDGRHARDILLGLRFRMDLYVNFRPCVLMSDTLSPLKGIAGRPVNIEIFRENTEGLYTGVGGSFKKGTPDEVAVQEALNTRKGVERIIRAAFAHAVQHGRQRVTLVDKANAMPILGGLWRRTFADVASEFPGIETEAGYVDAVAMDFIRRPERYQVVVTANLFGDILSDVAAAVTGGLGLAPSANFHPGRFALFEPVHGSAPDIAGQGRANPIGAIRSVALLLSHFGFGRAAEAVDQAVLQAIRTLSTTPDLGGSLTTEETGTRIAESLSEA